MKIVDIPELKEMALREIDRCRKELLETKNLIPIIVLLAPIREEQGDTYIAVDGNVMNDSASKSWLAQKVRQEIREKGYTATLFISDVYGFLDLTESENRKRQALAQLGIIEFSEIARILGLSHKLKESILATMETIDGRTLVVIQDYHRDPEGNVIAFEEIRDSAHMANSRFKFFDQQEEGVRGA